MVILISGASHTGKTLVSQKLMEELNFPYISMDHLKMGMIRSQRMKISPESSIKEITKELWPTVKEIICTAIENNQNLIIEGCYVPENVRNEFDVYYLNNMFFCFLVFHQDYIINNYEDILNYENIIEKRESISFRDELQVQIERENKYFLDLCEKYQYPLILIKNKFNMECIISNILDYIKKSNPNI